MLPLHFSRRPCIRDRAVEISISVCKTEGSRRGLPLLPKEAAAPVTDHLHMSSEEGGGAGMEEKEIID